MVILCCSTGLWGQQKNPLLDIIGKPYAEYFPIYDHLYDSLHNDPQTCAELSRMMVEAQAADKTGEWKLNFRLFEYMVQYHRSRKGGFIPSADYTAEDFALDMVALSREAAKKGLPCLELYSLYQIAQSYRLYEPQNFELAFEYFRQLSQGLQKIQTVRFPMKPYCYLTIADFYYAFKDYPNAMELYERILIDPKVEGNIYQSSAYMHARNGMGLCYRYGFDDPERSDYYFQLNIERSAEGATDVWKGISYGNLGINRKLAGDYGKAIPLLKRSLDIMLLHSDYSFASRISLVLGEIYFDRGDMEQARKYIGLTDRYISANPNQGRLAQLFMLKSKYYIRKGVEREAAMYLDSALMTSKKYDDKYNAMILRRVEQRSHLIEKRAMNEQLSFEHERSTLFKRSFMAAVIGAFLLLALLTVTFYFYRKKRSAYRELVRRSQNWARGETSGDTIADEFETDCDKAMDEPDSGMAVDEENTTGPETIASEESNKVIMTGLEKVMWEKKLYKRSELSLDILAAETGLNRYYISTALNRCAGKNFSSYVNEYRIKEAIRIMSDPANDKLTLDCIAYESGFNDRQNFHRVFKKSTGLSPGDFRKNINK